ncbi:MAG: ABC transporter ATP-binding protein [Azonexaceae bacterium]|uniref:ABC transporter ATP-binding protein n=1 Tax=Azonexus sp. R2A61 TaxID=2744443 RepID=UPI001F4363FB|nr:ABC transporter ATP-binding protein [Azonexus sp. R2A61]MCE1240375.1 ABC transporter ATP-binding protein [Azonexaceae bacterium]
MSFVKFENVSLAYAPGGANAIEDVSLDIREGEFVAVVGPSGCGKSTLMKLVSGLKPPSVGNVFVDGREVGGPLKIVGMAFQAANLLPWRTTLDNVMLPLEIVEPYRGRLRQEKEKFRADAEALLARVGLAGYGDKFPWELSGGMQQRASICRALIHQPRLLMLDEPFGALDAFTREELWCMLRDLWQEKPFTIVLVTHDLREAVFLADTVYVMSKRPGRILVRKEIDLPRPRPLDVTYTDAFAGYVHELREHIGRIRES